MGKRQDCLLKHIVDVNEKLWMCVQWIFANILIWLANMTGDLFLFDLANKQRTNLLLFSLQILSARSSFTQAIFKCHFFKSKKKYFAYKIHLQPSKYTVLAKWVIQIYAIEF